MRRLLMGLGIGVVSSALLVAFIPRSPGPSGIKKSVGKLARVPAGDLEVFPQSATGLLKQPSRFYRFKRGVQVQFGGQELVDLHLEGRLAVRELSPRVFELSLRIDSPAQAAVLMPLYRVSLSEQAQVQRVEVDGPVSDSTGRMAEDLLGQYFFFQTRDTQGEFQARFLERDARHFEKRKTAYLDPPYSLAEIQDSFHSLTMGEQGQIQKIQGHETLISGARQSSLHSRTDYQIVEDTEPQLVPSTPLSAPMAWQERPFFKPMSSLHRTSAPAGEASDSLARLPPLLELLAKIRKDARPSDRTSLYRSLVKRLNSSPSDLTVVIAALGELKSEPQALRIVIGALAATSRPEAHQALQGAYGDSTFPPQTREMILNAWTATEVALPDTTRAFLKSIDSGTKAEEWEKQGALLAIAAQLPRAADVLRRAEIEDLLEGKLVHAREETQQLAALDAIGNSGSVNLASHVRDYLSDPNERIRARAFLALRRMPGPDIQAMLINGRSDSSPEVRRSVELALTMREP